VQLLASCALVVVVRGCCAGLCWCARTHSKT